MRYFRIFLLHFQEMIAERGRLFVWLIVNAMTPTIFLLFWRGTKGAAGWSLPEILSYYLLMIVLSTIIMTHHEEVISRIDIKEGQLTSYLLKPFSYFWTRFLSELSFRLFQGTCAIIIVCFLIFFFPESFVITDSLPLFLGALALSVLAYFLIFLFKMMLGMVAFWFVDTRAAFEGIKAITAILAGFLMPLAFFPHWLEQLSYHLPFAYMLYFPILAFEGRLTYPEMWRVAGIQVLWLSIFFVLYKCMWKAGLRRYTGVGQ